MSDPVGADVDLLARLTESQRLAVTAPDQRVCVLAGAGAGKTRVLTMRIAEMVGAGTDPSTILAVTFSRKAAQELRRRLWHLGVEGVRAGTFHRTALELLEIHRADQGLGPPVILTDRRGALERAAEQRCGTRGRGTGAALDTEVTWAKSSGYSPASYVVEATKARRRAPLSPHEVAEIWQDYEEAKARQGSVDFDDLIIDACTALEDPRFAAAIHWRTRHLLIDEFQDVNAMQFALIERLMTPTTTLFSVGDPNQSIYAFNGADPSLLVGLATKIEGTRVITLDTNHRSSPEIVRAASTVLTEHERRPSRSTQPPDDAPTITELDDDEAEAAFVARRAAELRGPGGHWRSIAVLARTNAQLTTIAAALDAAGVPSQTLAADLTRASDVTQARTEARRPHSEPRIDAVTLGTFHRAKGLEWPHVIIIGASEGLIPHGAASTAAALDEERRLLYVAMTRAERSLTITWAARRSRDEPRHAPRRRRSPFLDPLARELERIEGERRPGAAARGASRAAALRKRLTEERQQREALAGRSTDER